MKFIVLLLSIWSIYSYAENGTRGGGSAVGDQLLDFYENAGTTPFKVLESVAYREKIRPKLEIYAQDYPAMLPMFEQRIAMNYKWSLEAKPLTESFCSKGANNLTDHGKVISCLIHDEEVRIDSTWWNNAKPEAQARVIFFNLIANRESEKRINQFLNKFFALTLSTDEFRRYLSELMYLRNFYTPQEYNKYLKFVHELASPSLMEFCLKRDKPSLEAFIKYGLLSTNALYYSDPYINVDTRRRFEYLDYPSTSIIEAIGQHSPWVNLFQVTDEKVRYFLDVFLKDKRLAIFGLYCRK